MKFKLAEVGVSVEFDDNVELEVNVAADGTAEYGWSHLSTSARMIKHGTSKT